MERQLFSSNGRYSYSAKKLIHFPFSTFLSSHSSPNCWQMKEVNPACLPHRGLLFPSALEKKKVSKAPTKKGGSIEKRLDFSSNARPLEKYTIIPSEMCILKIILIAHERVLLMELSWFHKRSPMWCSCFPSLCNLVFLLVLKMYKSHLDWKTCLKKCVVL